MFINFKDQKDEDKEDKKKKKDHASDSDSDERDEYEEVRLRRKRSCICCCCCPRYSCCNGDRLVNFLIYDFLVFALVIGYLGYYVFGLDKLQQEYQLKTSILFAQVIYGLLNFPFIIFLMKPCVLFLSKSRETGYDRDGICVPKYLASDMYKFRFSKKRILINSHGISLKVDEVPRRTGQKEENSRAEKYALSENKNLPTSEALEDPSKQDPESNVGGFSIEIDIEDMLKLENILKIS